MVTTLFANNNKEIVKFCGHYDPGNKVKVKEKNENSHVLILLVVLLLELPEKRYILKDTLNALSNEVIDSSNFMAILINLM